MSKLHSLTLTPNRADSLERKSTIIVYRVVEGQCHAYRVVDTIVDGHVHTEIEHLHWDSIKRTDSVDPELGRQWDEHVKHEAYYGRDVLTLAQRRGAALAA